MISGVSLSRLGDIRPLCAHVGAARITRMQTVRQRHALIVSLFCDARNIQAGKGGFEGRRHPERGSEGKHIFVGKGAKFPPLSPIQNQESTESGNLAIALGIEQAFFPREAQFTPSFLEIPMQYSRPRSNTAANCTD